MQFTIKSRFTEFTAVAVLMVLATGTSYGASVNFDSGVNVMGPEYTCYHSFFGDVFEHTEHMGDPAGIPQSADDALADALVSWGIKTVRVPLNEHCWLGTAGDSLVSAQSFPEIGTIGNVAITGSYYRDRVQVFSNSMGNHDIKVILDLHRSGPSSDIPTVDHQQLGQHPAPDAEYSEIFWRSVANRFKNDPHVIFDLFNEPNSISWECWRDGTNCNVGYPAVGMLQLLQAVRDYAPNNTVILSGIDWAEDLSGWVQEVDGMIGLVSTDNLVAGFHPYKDVFVNGQNFPKLDCSDLSCLNTNSIMNHAKAIRDHATYGLAITEMGQNVGWEDSASPDPGLDCQSTDFVEALLAWSKLNDVPVLPWTWNPSRCDTPSLQQEGAEHWDGSNPNAYGNAYYTFLQQSDTQSPQGEIVDQNATNAWYLPGDGTRSWIDSDCASSLEAQGMPRRNGTWNDDLASLTGMSISCDDIVVTTVVVVEEPPEGEIVDQNVTNAWYLPGDGTRSWIDSDCASSLEAQGMPRRNGTWNDDLASLSGTSIACDAI